MLEFPKFRYRGSKGRSLVKLNDTFKLFNLENPPS